MMLHPRCVALFVLLALAISSPARASKIDPALLSPDVRVLIDTSRIKFDGENQADSPRDNRGIALSPDGRYMYLGYNNSVITGPPAINRQGEVRRVDLQTGEIDAFDKRVLGVRGKSISVDDKGRVYLAENANIQVYDKDLNFLKTIPLGLRGDAVTNVNSEGIEVRREGSDLFAYVTDRGQGNAFAGISKWKINEGAGVAVNGAALEPTFGVGGVRAIPEAFSLRGIDVDSSGNIWAADFGNAGGAQPGQVLRIPASGIGAAVIHSFGVNSTIVDVAINPDATGDQVLVSGFVNRTLRMFDASAFPGGLNFGDGDVGNGYSFVIPWTSLALDPDGNQFIGSLSGIAVVPNRGFYVTNESGQTANEKSIYGVVDANSGLDPLNPGDPTFYRDRFRDDNEPVLSFLIPVPEPAALALGSIALASFLLYSRRQRKQSNIG